MSRLLTSPLEMGPITLASGGVDGHSAGTVACAVDNSVYRSGAGAMKYDSGAGAGTSNSQVGCANVVFGTRWFERIYLQFSNLPSETVRIINIRDSPGTSIFSVKITAAGKVQLFNQSGGTQIGSDSSETIVASETTWHKFHLSCVSDTGAADGAELYLNDVLVAATTGLSLTDNALNTFQIGWVDSPGASRIMRADDHAINDSNGTDEASYPGEGRVYFSYPIADVSRVGWTGGAGGTISLFEALNNQPPSGVAVASATDVSQIVDLADNETDTYVASMQSATSAGVPENEVVTVLQTYVELGQNDIVGTGVGVELTLNPVSLEESAGASTVAVGTRGTGWYGRFQNDLYSPSIDQSSPTNIKIRKATASATITQTVDSLLLLLETQEVASVPVNFPPTIHGRGAA